MYIRFSVVKIQNFQIKKFDIFSYFFCSIHRLWVHIRTVSARRYIIRTCYPDDKHRKHKRKRNLTWHYSTFIRKPVHAIYSIVSAVLIKISRFFIIIFLIIAQNIDCGYTLEPPCRGGSNEYPQSMF